MTARLASLAAAIGLALTVGGDAAAQPVFRLKPSAIEPAAHPGQLAFAITGVRVTHAAGFEDGEGNAWAIDLGSTVHVDLSVRNTGAADLDMSSVPLGFMLHGGTVASGRCDGIAAAGRTTSCTVSGSPLSEEFLCSLPISSTRLDGRRYDGRGGPGSLTWMGELQNVRFLICNS